MKTNQWLEGYVVGMKQGVTVICDNSCDANSLRDAAMKSIRKMERKLRQETTETARPC